MLLYTIYNTSCDNNFINLLGGSSIAESSGVNILRKVSNIFGTLLNKDIDNEGDNDAVAYYLFLFFSSTKSITSFSLFKL